MEKGDKPRYDSTYMLPFLPTFLGCVMGDDIKSPQGCGIQNGPGCEYFT